jgi:Sec-independent protein secretion pathway component TatC
VWTTIAMAVPRYLLYEVSVLLTIIIYRRRLRREAALEAQATA